jgi:hypothetical protein
MGTYSKRVSNVNSVRILEVIEVRSICGAATEADPVREVVEYFSMDGVLLARHDSRSDDLQPVRTEQVVWPGETRVR